MKEIPLTNSDRKVLVDDEDYPLLSRHVWRLDETGYAMTDLIRMHAKAREINGEYAYQNFS